MGSPAETLREMYEREKARADDEYERAEMFQRDARRSDAALVAEKARAEKAEADEAIAWSEVHDHEAVIRNFEKSVDKLEAALAAARRECERLAKEWDQQAESVRDEQPHTAQDLTRCAKELRAAIAAPAAGEEKSNG